MNYVASYPKFSISIEDTLLHQLLSSLDLVPIVDLVIPSMGALEPTLPPIGPGECHDLSLIQDDFIPSDEALLEAMVTSDIPLDAFGCFHSKEHFPGLDPLVIKSSPDLPSEIDLIHHRSLEFPSSLIELQVGVHFESSFSDHESLESFFQSNFSSC